MFSEMRGRDRNLGMGNAPARTLHAILQRRCILSQVPRGTCPVYSTHDQVLIYCVLIPTEQLFTCLCTSTTTGPQQGRNILRFHSLHCIMHCIALDIMHCITLFQPFFSIATTSLMQPWATPAMHSIHATNKQNRWISNKTSWNKGLNPLQIYMNIWIYMKSPT